MKREASPHTPYKRKAKGKETSPGFFRTPLSPRARARQNAKSQYAEAGAAADELISVLGAQATEYNRRLWAFYCYHHDIGIILDKAYEFASMRRQGEIRNAVTRFQKWLIDSYGGEQ